MIKDVTKNRNLVFHKYSPSNKRYIATWSPQNILSGHEQKFRELEAKFNEALEKQKLETSKALEKQKLLEEQIKAANEELYKLKAKETPDQ